MHELSIITGVIDSTLKVAHEQNATLVRAINLKIGVMVDAIDDALRASFEMLAEDESKLKGCKLNIQYVDPTSRCLECGETYAHDRFDRRCPACSSDIVELTAGNEIEIVSIEIESS